MSLKNDEEKGPSKNPRLIQSERPRNNKRPPPKTGQKETNAGGSERDTPVRSQSGSPVMFNVADNKGGTPKKGASTKDNSPSGSRSGSPVVISGNVGSQSPTGSVNSKSASRPGSRAESRTASIKPIEPSSSGVGSPSGSVRGRSTPPSGSSREGSRRRVSENRSESPIFYPNTPHEKESGKGGSLGGSRAASPTGSLVSFEEPGLQSQQQQQAPEAWATANANGGSNFVVAIQPIVEEDTQLDGTAHEQDFNAMVREDILMVSISQQEVIETNENNGEEDVNDKGEGSSSGIPPPPAGEGGEGTSSGLKSNKVLLQPMTIEEDDGRPRWKKRSKHRQCNITIIIFSDANTKQTKNANLSNDTLLYNNTSSQHTFFIALYAIVIYVSLIAQQPLHLCLYPSLSLSLSLLLAPPPLSPPPPSLPPSLPPRQASAVGIC